MVASRDFRWSFSIQFIQPPQHRMAAAADLADALRALAAATGAGQAGATRRDRSGLSGGTVAPPSFPRSAPLTTSNRLLLVFRKVTYARFW
jgi:hypothetical protein